MKNARSISICIEVFSFLQAFHIQNLPPFGINKFIHLPSGALRPTQYRFHHPQTVSGQTKWCNAHSIH